MNSDMAQVQNWLNENECDLRHLSHDMFHSNGNKYCCLKKVDDDFVLIAEDDVQEDEICLFTFDDEIRDYHLNQLAEEYIDIALAGIEVDKTIPAEVKEQILDKRDCLIEQEKQSLLGACDYRIVVTYDVNSNKLIDIGGFEGPGCETQRWDLPDGKDTVDIVFHSIYDINEALEEEFEIESDALLKVFFEKGL